MALAAVMAGRRSVAVAGTHGKTSTTSMLTVAVQACGVDPSFAIGGDLNESGSNAHAGEGDVFVAEADESDRSFLLLAPFAGIVTNVEADHLDNYGDLAAVEAAFDTFLGTVHPDGFVVLCADDPGAARLRGVPTKARLRTYGLADDADLRLLDLEVAQDGTSYTAVLDGRVLGRVAIQLPGRAHGAQQRRRAARRAGAGPARRGPDRRPGPVRRRPPPVRAQGRGRRGARLRRLRPPPDRGHRAAARRPCRGRPAGGWWWPSSRTSTAGPWSSPTGSAAPSALADEVVVMDVYGAREDPVPGVTGAMVADAVPLPPERVLFEPSWSAAAPALAARARPGDLVMTMGAGDVSMVGPGGARGPARRPDATAGTSAEGTRHPADSDEPHGHHHAGPDRQPPPDARAPSAGAGDAAGPPSPADPARSRRRRTLRLGAALLLLVAALWFLWAGPVLAVGTVQVDGAGTLAADEVRKAAGIEVGTPLLRVDVEDVEARVARLPQISAVEVTRGWPQSVVITVVERVPVAVVGEAGRRSLVDADGVLFDTITGAPPPGVVPLEVADPGPGDAATMAALEALVALPGEVRDGIDGAAVGRPGGHHAHADRRHARAVGRPGRVGHEGDRAHRPARPDGRRRPGAGRHHRPQHPRRGGAPLAGWRSMAVCRPSAAAPPPPSASRARPDQPVPRAGPGGAAARTCASGSTRSRRSRVSCPTSSPPCRGARRRPRPSSRCTTRSWTRRPPGCRRPTARSIVVATSAANDCLYCVVAHGAIARVRSRDPYLADQVAVDWRKAPLSPRMHAVLDVAVRLAVEPAAVTAQDLADLRGHGLTEDDVWDVGAIVSFFALSNRLAHWAAIPPNPEFFLLGRVPRA